MQGQSNTTYIFKISQGTVICRHRKILVVSRFFNYTSLIFVRVIDRLLESFGIVALENSFYPRENK